jgi:hypothetical protein
MLENFFVKLNFKKSKREKKRLAINKFKNWGGKIMEPIKKFTYYPQYFLH